MRSLFRYIQLKPSATDSIEGLRHSSSRLGFGMRSVVTSCRAVLLPCFGGADVLEVRDNVRVPDLKPNEVLVRVRAVSVNPLDTRDASAIPFAALTAWRALISTARISKARLWHL